MHTFLLLCFVVTEFTILYTNNIFAEFLDTWVYEDNILDCLITLIRFIYCHVYVNERFVVENK